MGGGRHHFTPYDKATNPKGRADGRDLMAEFAAKGYYVAGARAGMMAAPLGRKFVGIYSANDHLDYAISLIEGVAQNLDRIDELIASYAEGWTIDRMPVVDRNLARIAVFELLYVPEIDDPVAISEAVELAKQMSTDDSPRFLNGILGRIAEFATR